MGAADTVAFFVNTADGTIDIDGGPGGTARAVSVDSLAVFDNAGTVNLTGGNPNNRFYSKGTVTNQLGGVLDFGDGRLSTRFGSFVNDGLVRSTRDGAGVLADPGATVTNNAFFDYAAGNRIASGQGTIIENGLNLRTKTRINAGGACAVDIASAPYEYFFDGGAVVASDTGLVVFTNNSLPADSVVLTTTIPGIELTVRNYCADVVMSSGLFGGATATRALRIFPTLVSPHQTIRIELPPAAQERVSVRLYDAAGRLRLTRVFAGAEQQDLALPALPAGRYSLHALAAGQHFAARLVVQ